MVAIARNAPDRARVLTAIVACRVARLPVADLAAAMGVPALSLGGPLEGLERASLVTRWVMPSDRGQGVPAVTLSPLGAFQLGIRLNSSGDRWLVEGETEPPERAWELTESDVTAADGPGRFETIPDPEALPADELMARGETLLARYRSWLESGPADPDDEPPRLPSPRTLVGQRLIWNGPAHVAARGGACPACRGRQLAPSEACLICDRSGIDGILEASPAPTAAARGTSPLAARAARIKGRTSPLAATWDGAHAAKAKAERDRLRAAREADARDRERLMEARRGTAKSRARVTA